MFGRSQSLPGADSLLAKPIDKQHTDTVVNFLIRVACQVLRLGLLENKDFFVDSRLLSDRNGQTKV